MLHISRPAQDWGFLVDYEVKGIIMHPYANSAALGMLPFVVQP